MFKKILVAQDGSDGSARVLPLAVAMAEDTEAEIVLAHVDEQTIGKGRRLSERPRWRVAGAAEGSSE